MWERGDMRDFPTSVGTSEVEVYPFMEVGSLPLLSTGRLIPHFAIRATPQVPETSKVLAMGVRARERKSTYIAPLSVIHTLQSP